MSDAPDQRARDFYAALMESKCDISWAIFSKASKTHFSQWAFEEVYNRNREAVEKAKLGLKEIRLMFERNDSLLMKYFWRRFFFASGANEIYRLGYFDIHKIEGKTSIVKVTLKYPNGQVREVGLPMVKEGSKWHLAYVENDLPF